MAHERTAVPEPYLANEEAQQKLEWLSGQPVSVLLDSATSAGQLMILRSTPPAGSASPLHVHGREDEVFILISGAALVVVGDATHEVRAGGVAFLPRDIPHAYRITDDAHLLTICTPAGLEGFFRTAGRDLSLPMPDGWAITPESLAAALDPFGGRIVGPPPPPP